MKKIGELGQELGGECASRARGGLVGDGRSKGRSVGCLVGVCWFFVEKCARYDGHTIKQTHKQTIKKNTHTHPSPSIY